MYNPQASAPAVWEGSGAGFHWSVRSTGNLLPATHTPVRRNALMIAAHFVWGTTIAMVVRLMRRSA